MTTHPMIENAPHGEEDAVNRAETASAAAAENAAEAAPVQAITEAAVDAAPSTDEAMRKQVPPVEAAIEPHPNAEALLPPPIAQLPKPKQSSGENVSIHDAKVENLILLPTVLTSAERNLATHIGSMIDPMLEKNLLLSVSNNLDKGTTSLILSFEGDMVPANPAVLSEQIVAALHKVTAMQPLFAQHHHAPVSNVHDGRLEVMIRHLTTAQYAHLVQSLASGIEVSAVASAHTPAHAHPAAEVAAEVQATATAAMAGNPPATEVAAVNHEGLANNNARELTQTAVGR